MRLPATLWHTMLARGLHPGSHIDSITTHQILLYLYCFLIFRFFAF